MDNTAPPSFAERAYAAVVVIIVPTFFGLILLATYLKNGTFDTEAVKKDVMYFLGYIGTISIAIRVGNSRWQRVADAFSSDLLRSMTRFGIPLFLFTTAFSIAFPTQIRLTEHIGFNLLLSLLASCAWKHEQSDQLTASR